MLVKEATGIKVLGVIHNISCISYVCYDNPTQQLKMNTFNSFVTYIQYI